MPFFLQEFCQANHKEDIRTPVEVMEIDMPHSEEGCSRALFSGEARATQFRAPVANMKRQVHLDRRDLVQVDLSSEPGAGPDFSDVDVVASAEVESGPPSPSDNHRTSYFDNNRNDEDSDYEPPQVPRRENTAESSMPSTTPETSSHRRNARVRAFKLRFGRCTNAQQRSRLIRINRLRTIRGQYVTQWPAYPLYPTSLAYLEDDRRGFPENEPLPPEDGGANYLKALVDLAQSEEPCVSERLKRNVERRVEEGIYPEKTSREDFIAILDVSDVLLGRDPSRIVRLQVSVGFLAQLATTPCGIKHYGRESDREFNDLASITAHDSETYPTTRHSSSAGVESATGFAQHALDAMEQLNTLVDSPMESDSGPDSDPRQQSTPEPEWEKFVIDLPMSGEEEQEEDNGNNENHDPLAEGTVQSSQIEIAQIGTHEYTSWMLEQWKQVAASQDQIQEHKRLATEHSATAQARQKRASDLHERADGYQHKADRMRQNAAMWRDAAERKARIAEVHNDRFASEQQKLADVQAKLTGRG